MVPRLAFLAVAALLAGAAAQPGKPRPPSFPESFRAELEQILVNSGSKGGLPDGDVHQATLYYDRRRQAERLDVHTFETSYLFLYGQARAYMTTSDGSCFTAVLSKPQLVPRVGTSAMLVSADASLGDVGGLEHWAGVVPGYGNKEEVWVKRDEARAGQGWPFRERFYRDAGKGREMVVEVDYLDFQPGRQDPALFRAPAGDACHPFPGPEFASALEARNTLHFNPLHIPHVPPVEMVPQKERAEGGASTPVPSLDQRRDDGTGPAHMYKAGGGGGLGAFFGFGAAAGGGGGGGGEL